MTKLTQRDRRALTDLVNSDCAAWMERNFWIPDPRDPVTGVQLPPGPIQLAEVQKAILRYALTKVRGRFPYSTFLFSTIKKSGKTRLAAGIAAWYAATQGAYNEVYCLANDGKQSADRILTAIKQGVLLNPELREGANKWTTTKTRIVLPSGTFIEAIPCDPTGQAGANPGMTVWSELWGYQETHKARLWSEMTIPPTRYGHALRIVESYAGFKDESTVLQDLYVLGVKKGTRHPAFTEHGQPPVYINRDADLIAYWDEGDAARRMPWQQGADGEAYYRSQALTLLTDEFDRIHRNKWVERTTKAIPVEWWDACRGNVPPLDGRTPIVIGVDAAVSGDCCACIGVSRSPHNNKHVMVRLVRVWEPPKGGQIDLTDTIEATLREWIEKYNVVEVAYDAYQLHKMMTDLRKERIVKLYEFGQRTPRSKADKQLHQMIIHRQIAHGGNSVLRQHVDNASAKLGDSFRFVKKDTKRVTDSTAIDALVALSMAGDECLRLTL